MEYTRKAHSVYYTRYHIIVSTKYRKKVLNSGMSAYLKIKLYEVQKHYPEIQLIEVNTDKDHMHLLISIPPDVPVSHAVSILKANTAKAMRKKFTFLDQVYFGFDGFWSVGYFVSTVGVNESVIQAYIEHQGQEDSGQAKLELG